jgi:Ion channel
LHPSQSWLGDCFSRSRYYKVIYVSFSFSIFLSFFPFISVAVIMLFGNKIKVPSPSPRIMSPMGYAVNRQARHIASVMDENSLYGDDYDAKDMAYDIKPVPIWLCVFLVIGYIIGGSYMFNHLEGWGYLDSAYFCFITLTTIGESRASTFRIAMHFLGRRRRMF